MTLRRSSTAGPLRSLSRRPNSATRARWAAISGLAQLRCGERSHPPVLRRAVHAARAAAGVPPPSAVSGQPEAEPELALSSNSELDHAGRVRWRQSSRVWLAGCRRRSMSRPVAFGNHQLSPNQLREQLDIWRFAAALAGAGEFKQRVQELCAANRPKVDP